MNNTAEEKSVKLKNLSPRLQSLIKSAQGNKEVLDEQIQLHKKAKSRNALKLLRIDFGHFDNEIALTIPQIYKKIIKGYEEEHATMMRVIADRVKTDNEGHRGAHEKLSVRAVLDIVDPEFPYEEEKPNADEAEA